MARPITALAIAAMLCCAANADSKNCHLGRFASLPITFDNVGLPTVPITIDGTPVSMLVDTGAEFSMLDISVVVKFKLPEGASGHTEMLFGGQWSRMATRVPVFEIGESTVDKHAFVVSTDGTFVAPSDGDLAADVLAAFDLDFDFASGTLNFMSQDHCPGKVVYWTKGGYAAAPFDMDKDDRHIRIDVLLDGKTVSAVLDTGSNWSTMSLEAAQDIFKLQAAPGRAVHIFKELTLQGVTVNNPEIVLVPDDQSKVLHVHGQPDMILGMDVLRTLHLYIAYKEHMLYATDADAH